MELETLERKTLYKQVGEQLRDYIITNNLQNGDKLPTELELMKKFRVSRNSVREGLRYLETMGFIETTVKTGITVKIDNTKPITDYLLFSLDNSHVSRDEMNEARKVIESAAIELVIRKIDSVTIKNLEKSLERMLKEINSGKKIDQEDYYFHSILFKATKNKLLEQFIKIIQKYFYSNELYKSINKESNIKTYKEHMRILEAIKNRNIDEGKKEMNKHLLE